MENINNKKQRALISGAGIAGLTTAYWLIQIGWDVVIIEKANQLREGEFVIDFSGTGWDVAEKMGLADVLRQKEMEITALSFQNHLGQEKANIRMKDFTTSLGVGDKHVSINRKDLQNMIYDLIKSDAEIRFSSSISAIKSSRDFVEVSINNALYETFDLVVGADGLHSNVRQLTFTNDSAVKRHLGYNVSAFRVKNVSNKEAGLMNILRLPNKQAGILDLRDGDSLALFVYSSDNKEYIPHEQRKQVLLDTFGDIQGPVPAVLNGINEHTSIYMDSTTQIVMPRWHSNRVVLVGDAAYCLTLVSGQGASLAMGGAYVLAQALDRHAPEDIQVALTEYDNRLRPFVEELQGKSKNFASQFIPSSNFGLWSTNQMVSLIKLPFVKTYVGKLFNIQSLFEREAQQNIEY